MRRARRWRWTARRTSVDVVVELRLPWWAMGDGSRPRCRRAVAALLLGGLLAGSPRHAGAKRPPAAANAPVGARSLFLPVFLVIAGGLTAGVGVALLAHGATAPRSCFSCDSLGPLGEQVAGGVLTAAGGSALLGGLVFLAFELQRPAPRAGRAAPALELRAGRSRPWLLGRF